MDDDGDYNDDEGPRGYCHGCGKRPRTSLNDGSIVLLKRCTRCRKAFYCDASCQRNHWQHHRQECCRRSSQQQQQQQQRLRVVERPGRGRCLFAVKRYPAGEVISSSSSSASFQPFVPPVLNSAHRKDRCAYCFGKIDLGADKNNKRNNNINSSIEVCNLDTYKVLVCSTTCHEAGRDFFLAEAEALKALYASPGGGPPVLLPSALFVYRLLLAIALHQISWQEIDGMHGQGLAVGSSEDESEHQQAVIMTVAAMIAFTNNNNNNNNNRNDNIISKETLALLRAFGPNDVIRVTTKMKLNAYTISSGDNSNNMSHASSSSSLSSSSAIGFGLYRTAYRINHSCTPNAVQTFVVGQPGSLPRITITACRLIEPNEEICVSYIEDTGQSRQKRQKELQTNYRFRCTCKKCTEEEQQG